MEYRLVKRRPYKKIENEERRRRVFYYNRKAREKNLEAIREANRRWQQKNKDYHLEYKYRKHLEKFGVPPPPPEHFVSQLEKSWREIFYRNFPTLEFFTNIRPWWLKNTLVANGRNLELDLYNKYYNFAVEINGEQHYRFTPLFHKNYASFIYQQERDFLKKKLCEKRDVKLYIVNRKSIPKFVVEDVKNYIESREQKMCTTRDKKTITLDIKVGHEAPNVNIDLSALDKNTDVTIKISSQSEKIKK